MMASRERFGDEDRFHERMMSSSSNRFNDDDRFHERMMPSNVRYEDEEMIHNRMMRSDMNDMDMTNQRMTNINQRFSGDNSAQFGEMYKNPTSMNFQGRTNNFPGSGMMEGRGMMGMDSMGFRSSNDFNREPIRTGMMGMDSSGFRGTNERDPWKDGMDSGFGNQSRINEDFDSGRRGNNQPASFVIGGAGAGSSRNTFSDFENQDDQVNKQFGHRNQVDSSTFQRNQMSQNTFQRNTVGLNSFPSNSASNFGLSKPINFPTGRVGGQNRGNLG